MEKKEKKQKKVRAKAEHQYIARVGWAFMVVGTVLMAFALIPMAWCIPMTVYAKNRIHNNEHIGVGFKVCALLFVGLIGGILLLCDNENKK